MLGADGRPLARAPLPPKLVAKLGANAGAVDAVMTYIEATGKLPRGVADALRAFLGSYPAFVRVETLGVGVRLPPYCAAALAVWMAPGDTRRLAVLAVANDWHQRWCTPVPPARPFAPVLCDRAALLAALPAGDATAAAFSRWDAAGEDAALGDVTLRTREPRLGPGDRAGEEKLSVVVEHGTAEGLSFVLVGGGMPGERAPIGQIEGEPGTTRLTFRVTPALFKPVLIVARGPDRVELRVGD